MDGSWYVVGGLYWSARSADGTSWVVNDLYPKSSLQELMTNQAGVVMWRLSDGTHPCTAARTVALPGRRWRCRRRHLYRLGVTPGAIPLRREQFGTATQISHSWAVKYRARVHTADQHYPAAARRDAVDGIVLVDLLLNIEGQVLEAQVIAESPPGFGFGLAALDTAKTFEFINPFRSQVLLSKEVAFLP